MNLKDAYSRHFVLTSPRPPEEVLALIAANVAEYGVSNFAGDAVPYFGRVHGAKFEFRRYVRGNAGAAILTGRVEQSEAGSRITIDASLGENVTAVLALGCILLGGLTLGALCLVIAGRSGALRALVIAPLAAAALMGSIAAGFDWETDGAADELRQLLRLGPGTPGYPSAKPSTPSAQNVK